MNTNIDDCLFEISSKIKDGFHYGYYPYFTLKITDIDKKEVSDITYEHIANLIIQGFKQGEVIEARDNQENQIGWWRIEIQEE